jgi:hypothetical protein
MLSLSSTPFAAVFAQVLQPLGTHVAYSGEIGRLFGLKKAGCSGKSATMLVAPD